MYLSVKSLGSITSGLDTRLVFAAPAGELRYGVSRYGVGNCCQFSAFYLIMDVVSRRISLTAWGRLYGFDKATTARMHHAGKLPPELQIGQLPNGRYYVVVPPENDGRLRSVRPGFIG